MKRLMNDLPSPPEGKNGWPWTEQSESLPERIPDGSEWPRISIVTPSYNQVQFLEETIRSVLLQNYPNLEYIIIDGGSIDGSVEIIKKYEPWLAYWESEKDRGQSHAINKGFSRCTGEVMNWINSDDYLLPNAFQRIAKKFQERKSDVFVIGGNAYRLKENGKLVPSLSIRPSTERFKKIGGEWDGGIQASWFFSKLLYNKVGAIKEEFEYAMDIEFSFRFKKYNPEYLIEDSYLAVYREHAGAKTYNLNKEALEERLFVYEQSINEMSYSDSEKAERFKIARDEISNLYLSRTGHPIKIKYILRSLRLSPNKIFRKKFWGIVIKDRFNYLKRLLP